VPQEGESKATVAGKVRGVGEPNAWRRRVKILLLAVLVPIHIVVTLFTAVPGYLSQDDMFYHWMAESMAGRGSLDLWNGYGEFPSPELVHPAHTAHGSRIFPPHPYLFPVLAFPFYRVAGFFGLIVLNCLCFMGLVALCFFTARKLFHDDDLALNSCFILIFGTFAWEYSQAAWPHISSTLFILAAFFLFVDAFLAQTPRRARWLAVASGLVGGLAMGIRIDCMLVFAGLILPFLYSRPCRPVEAMLVLVGALPGLTLLAVTNHVKFGVFNPLTYGGAVVMSHLPSGSVIIPLAIAMLVVWVTSRERVVERFEGRILRLYVAAAVVLLLGLLIMPEVRKVAMSAFANAYTMLFDIRSLSAESSFPPMSRIAGGAVVYNGALKKGLLQSLPFLPLLIVPGWSLFLRSEDRTALAVLAPVPAAYLAYNSYAFLQLEAGGGLGFNLRYLVPCLPFLAILCAFGLRELRRRSGRPLSLPLAAGACAGTAGIYFLLVMRGGTSPDRLELPLLVLPLVMAFALFFLLLWGPVEGFKQRPLLISATWVALMVTFTWSGLVAFLYDYPNHRRARAVHYGFARLLLPKIPDHSIFFAGQGFFTASARLLEKGTVIIAYPARDNYGDFPRLLTYHLGAGRRAFGAFTRDLWSKLEVGPLKRYIVRPVLSFPAFYVAEISPRPPDDGLSPAR
jgi:hypothetical protein